MDTYDEEPAPKKFFNERDFVNGGHKYSAELNRLERIFVADKANEKLDKKLKVSYMLSLSNSGMSPGNIEHFYNLFIKHLEVGD